MKHTHKAFDSLNVGDTVHLIRRSHHGSYLVKSICMKITPSGQVTVETLSSKKPSLRFMSDGREIGAYRYSMTGWMVLTQEGYNKAKKRGTKDHKEAWDRVSNALNELNTSISKKGFSAKELREAAMVIMQLSNNVKGERP